MPYLSVYYSNRWQVSCWTCFHREWLGPASAQARLQEKQKSLEQDLQQKEQSAGVLSHPKLNNSHNSVCFGLFRDILGYFGILYLTIWLWWFEPTEWTRYFQPFSAQPQIKPYAEILNLQQHRLEDGERIQAMQQEMAEAMGDLLGSLVIFEMFCIVFCIVLLIFGSNPEQAHDIHRCFHSSQQDWTENRSMFNPSRPAWRRKSWLRSCAKPRSKQLVASYYFRPDAGHDMPCNAMSCWRSQHRQEQRARLVPTSVLQPLRRWSLVALWLGYASLCFAILGSWCGKPWHSMAAKVSTEEVELTHTAQRLRKARAQGFNMFQQRRTLFNICHLHAKPGQAMSSRSFWYQSERFWAVDI